MAIWNDVPVDSLESVIAAAPPEDLEAVLFGTRDPSVIADVLGSIVAASIGADVVGVRWYTSSPAAVAAVVLGDGRSVVVRAYQQSVNPAFIDGVIRVQHHLVDKGVPCAGPLGGTVIVDGAGNSVLGRVESLVPDPGARRFDPDEMAMSASGLATIVRLAAGVDTAGLETHPMVLPDLASQLYPAPHSPLFDFDATAAGAEWIDDIARAARQAITDDGAVIAHGDWSARNVRFNRNGLLAVFDFESLHYASESMSVGAAAATSRALGEEGEPDAPSADEITRFVAAYEVARGEAFTPSQRNSARAAALFVLAYTARCEHSLEPGVRTGRASGRLASDPQMLSLLEE